MKFPGSSEQAEVCRLCRYKWEKEYGYQQGSFAGWRRQKQNEKLVVTASSLGTVFEWYDFYLYGLLASVISAKFFRVSTKLPASSWL
nr:hypothetical protein [Sphingopyxis sp. BSNA05]